MKIPHSPGLTVLEAAEKLGVKERVIWRLIKADYLDVLVLGYGRGMFYVIPSSLEKYIAAGRPGEVHWTTRLLAERAAR